MGTWMKNAVFPEGVVNGIKRWRARAKKRMAAGKKNYWALNESPSLEASLDASIESSPSFSTLDPSLSVELGYTNTTPDDWNASVETTTTKDEDSDTGKKIQQQPLKNLKSFEGFNLDKKH